MTRYVAEIRSFIEPRRLYRYRSADHLDREIRAIEEGYLFCASFDDMNDPMEGLFASSKRLRESEGYRTFRQAVRNEKANVGICSFSEVYDHELMWAHYAGQFSGICISYSLRLLRESLRNDIEFVRMYYDESMPTIRKRGTSAEEAAKMVLSCKNYRWLYEREWRMFSSQGMTFYRQQKCVTRVYVGARMEPGEREGLAARLRPLKIPMSEMAVKRYSLAFEPRF